MWTIVDNSSDDIARDDGWEAGADVELVLVAELFIERGNCDVLGKSRACREASILLTASRSDFNEQITLFWVGDWQRRLDQGLSDLCEDENCLGCHCSGCE